MEFTDSNAYFKDGNYFDSKYIVDDDQGMSYNRDIEEIYSTFSKDGNVCLKRRINNGHCWGSDFSDESMDRDFTYFGTYRIVSEAGRNAHFVDLSFKSVFTTGRNCYIGCAWDVTLFHEHKDDLNLNVRVKTVGYPRAIFFVGENPITNRKEFIDENSK